MGFVYISMVKFKVTDLDNLGFCPTRVRENTWPALRHGDVVFVVRTLRLAALKVAVESTLISIKRLYLYGGL